jgi:hypothetical protein
MRPDAVELPVGVVFRRLRSGVETPDGRRTWYGLWDLAAGGTGPLGTVAVRRVGSGVVELCALSVPGEPWAVGDRLLRDVADALRADGAERLVATLPEHRELLLHAGFADASQLSEDDPGGGLVLEL